MQLKAIVAPKRTYRQKLFITYIMCTQMQRLKLNMNAVNQVKHSNCYLKSKSLHAVLNAINTITSVNDVYYVTSRCPYKLCSRVFQSRVISRPATAYEEHICPGCCLRVPDQQMSALRARGYSSAAQQTITTGHIH